MGAVFIWNQVNIDAVTQLIAKLSDSVTDVTETSVTKSSAARAHATMPCFSISLYFLLLLLFFFFFFFFFFLLLLFVWFILSPFLSFFQSINRSKPSDRIRLCRWIQVGRRWIESWISPNFPRFFFVFFKFLYILFYLCFILFDLIIVINTNSI